MVFLRLALADQVDTKTGQPCADTQSDKYRSLGHLLERKLTGEHADVVLFIDVSTGCQWTGLQIWEKIKNVACALVDLHNFQPGDAACIVYQHSITKLILVYGVIIAGGFVTCPHHRDHYEEVLSISQKVGPKYLFCIEKNLPEWGLRLQMDLGHQIKSFSIDVEVRKLLDYNSAHSRSFGYIPVARKPTDIAFITMSSGTTGRPKAVPVTHQTCLNDVNVFPSGTNPIGKRLGSTTSFDYVTGRLLTTHAMIEGYTSMVFDGYDPDIYLDAIERYRINVIVAGSAAFYNLITHPKFNQIDSSSIEAVFPTGAKINYVEIMRDFLSQNPQITSFWVAYGTSEVSIVSLRHSSVEDYLKDPESNGIPSQGFECKLIDLASKQVISKANCKGILHIRAPAMFPGYYDIKTKDLSFVRGTDIFDSEGYYITGDIAHFNEKGELYISGREKELMFCGVRKVLPHELEEVIEHHPAVSKVCVLGIDDKKQLTSHCPRAFVVLKPSYYSNIEIQPINRSDAGQQKTTELAFKGQHRLCTLQRERRQSICVELMQFTDQHLAWEKRLTGGIVILDHIPTLKGSGKMNKGYLRSLSLAQIEIYGDQSE